MMYPTESAVNSNYYDGRELWVMSGPGWQLPVSVDWYGGRSTACIRPGGGIPLLECQHKVLEKALSKVATERTPRRYWVTPQMLNLIAEKADTNDPEECVVWTRNSKTKEVKLIFDSKERNDFLKFYCKDGILSEPHHAAVIWEDFCTHALRWMLLHEKPWDLGFAVLHPSPYRVDWKHIIEELISFGKTPLLFVDKQHHFQKQNSTMEIFAKKGYLKHFLLPELLGLLSLKDVHGHQNKPHLKWGIEVRLKKGWMITNYRSEKWKREKKGNDAYIALCMDALKRHLPTSHALFNYYLLQMRLPILHMAKNKLTGKHDAVSQPKPPALPRTLMWKDGRPYYRLLNVKKMLNKAGLPMVAKTTYVSKVRVVRQIPKNLWYSRNDLAQPGISEK